MPKKSLEYGLSSYQDEGEGVVSEVRLKVISRVFVLETILLTSCPILQQNYSTLTILSMAAVLMATWEALSRLVN